MVPDGLRLWKYQKVDHNLHVREKTVLRISSTNDHRDSFRKTEKATYQFPLV